MTPSDLDELERLEREATGGPWLAVPWCQDEDGERHAPEIQENYGKTVVFSVCYDHPMRQEEANCALIVAARNALPAMLAECRESERLREQVDLLRSCLRRSRSYVERGVPLILTARDLVREINELLSATAPEGKP